MGLLDCTCQRSSKTLWNHVRHLLGSGVHIRSWPSIRLHKQALKSANLQKSANMHANETCSVQSLVLSTNSWMGGKNLFLGVCYLVVAGIAVLVSVGFLITYHLGCFGLVKRRKFGDVSQLSWNRNVVTR